MAVSSIQSLNTTKLNHHHHTLINFSDNFRPKSHSFGQVSLPMKTPDQCCTVSTNYASSMAPVQSWRRSSSENPKLGEMWREIQGCDNWDDLVQPLNPLLREEIVRYGEFVAACYKAFDFDPSSSRYLNCKYGKRTMLSEVGMGSSGYEVTQYVYATPDIGTVQDQAGASGDTARWIGYVAVATDEEASRLGRRDVLVSFRGTVTNPEWVANLMSSLVPARLDPNNPREDVKVESGFLSLYTSEERSSKFGPQSCREQLLSEVSRLLRKHRGEEMSITLAGHSMGSSLASLLAYDIAELGLNRGAITAENPNSDSDVPITVFSFGGPRVGNLGFKRRCEELGVKVLRVVNVNDPITKMPGFLFNDGLRVSLGAGKYEFPWSCSCYAHVGVELVLDFFNVQNPSCVHDLQTYIDLLKCPNKILKNNNLDKERNFINGVNNINLIGEDFLNRAKDFILNAQQNLNMLPWVNMVN